MTKHVSATEYNLDEATVAGFGDEWTRIDQRFLDSDTRNRIFQDYFSIFPWDILPEGAVGADIGCGSGRWATVVAPRVSRLLLFDASVEALAVARRNLACANNVLFEIASVDSLPVENHTLDFAYSLGVLHHVPDTAAAIRSISDKLKSGAPFLVYLYYSFENRGRLFRWVWQLSDRLRRIISVLPFGLRYWVSQVLAFLVYWPFSRMALILECCGIYPSSWPLAYYRDKPMYVLRTDALDRFGTRLEHRFSREEIQKMMIDAGFIDIRISNDPPYWCAVGIKG